MVIPCHRGLTTDITNGTKLPHHFIRHNNIAYPPGKYFKEQNDTVIRGCTCDLVSPCFRKCCPAGHTFQQNKCKKSNHTIATHFTPSTYERNVQISVPNNYFTIIHELYCRNGVYMLEPENNEIDQFYFQSNGHLYYPNSEQQFLPPEEFCLEFFEDINITTVLVCFPDPVEGPVHNSIGKR